MSKQYVRIRGDNESPEKFICRCGHTSGSKKDFKEHFRSSEDHDQRKLKL